jgi:hypothetical protein
MNPTTDYRVCSLPSPVETLENIGGFLVAHCNNGHAYLILVEQHDYRDITDSVYKFRSMQ